MHDSDSPSETHSRAESPLMMDELVVRSSSTTTSARSPSTFFGFHHRSPSTATDLSPNETARKGDTTHKSKTSVSGTLSGYTQQRRDLLDILKSLHSTGVQNELDLPQIVVVGSQSVGKSSLIESMSGISLPRDSGTCTRCPMECRLQSAPTWSCQIMLRFHVDSDGKPLPEVKQVTFGDTLYNKEDVEKMLRRAQRAILRPTLSAEMFLTDLDLRNNSAVHPQLTFSANCVCIHVSGPNVPDLYFYDLPGIIANVGDGGNEGDIQLVENLAKSYIERPNCIVLLVISCETDFENQGAGRLVLKNPELRQRTVGVLTKVDRIEAGGSARWLRILQNEDNTLRNGWFCVKQPDMMQLKAGISWEDARAAEKSFFENAAPWAGLERRFRTRLGAASLSECLSTNLSNLVARKLPQIQAEVAAQLRQVDDELLELAAPNLDDPRPEIVMMLREFNKEVSKHVQGLPPAMSTTDTEDPSPSLHSLIYSLHEVYENFRTNVNNTAPRFRPWRSDKELGEETEKEMIASASEDNPDGSNDMKVRYLDHVWTLAKRSRTRELPGDYPSSVKEMIFLESAKRWKALAQQCFKDVESVVSQHLDHLVKDHFGKHSYGGLLEAISDVVQNRVHERAQATSNDIDKLCSSEQSMYTQNEQYFFDRRTSLLQRYRAVHRQSLGQGVLFNALRKYGTTEGDGDRDVSRWRHNIDTIISHLANLGIHGVKAEDLARLLPPDEMESGLEIMAEVRAYFQVAFKRFADNIPKQIDSNFVRGLDLDLDVALRSMDLSDNQCREWLAEPVEILERRRELVGKKRRLEGAHTKLSHFFRMRLVSA
ncbi:hypothetical protein FRB99_000918 [Tulasnella sp. 403]|nr:hypothetical protein FRB99_000918 [Tulasnella sp. 403]